MWPRVSVLWVNYNSRHILSFVKRILLTLSELDYPDYEIIIVDNASNDGSWEVLKDFIRVYITPKAKVKMLRLSRNYGFTGGYNAAYALRDIESKYVVLVNTDAMPVTNMLKKYVVFMESHDSVGAAQGIIIGLGKYSKKVDSAGGIMDSFLDLYFPFKGEDYAKVLRLLMHKQYIEVSYVEGTMPIYRVKAVEEVNHFKNRLFITAGFAYYLEDVLLSMLLWTYGYKCVLIPFIAGYHLRGAIVQKHVSSRVARYYGERNRLALTMSLSAFTRYMTLLIYLRMIVISRYRRIYPRIIVDGIRLGRQLSKMLGSLSMQEIPQRKLSVVGILRKIL